MPSKYDTYLGLTARKYYGIKGGKVVPIYGHRWKIHGLTRPVVYWRTSRFPKGGVTFHGKFYNTRKEAQSRLRKV